MTLQTLAELNALNRAFWYKQNERFGHLLRRKYIQTFVTEGFVNSKPIHIAESAAEAYDRFRREPSLEAQVFAEADEKKSTGAFDRQKTRAQQGRWKVAGSGISRRRLIGAFASRPENRRIKTKALWQPFFDELVQLGLRPINKLDPINLDACTYTYDGKRGRVSISHRRFVKLVSETAPRKNKNGQA